MYIMNGICYADCPESDIEIIKAKALEDMRLLITFSTGEVRLFDATILDGSAFKPLQNKEIFKNFFVDHGVITWMDGTIDCAPEFIYEHSNTFELKY